MTHRKNYALVTHSMSIAAVSNAGANFYCVVEALL